MTPVSGTTPPPDKSDGNALLVKQLFLVQETLETYYLAAQESEAKLAQLEQTNSQLARLQADYQKLLAHLFKTQEALEQAVIASEAANIERDRYNDQVAYLSKQLDARNQALSHLDDDKQALERQLQATQNAVAQELQRRRASWYYRATQMLGKLRPGHRRLAPRVRLIESSGLFDRHWYMQHNPDVALRYANAAEHYLRHGGLEGRAASAAFSSKHYLKKYPDVAKAGQNPLEHYLLHGKAEGRRIEPVGR